MSELSIHSSISSQTTGPNCYQCLTIMKSGFSAEDPRHSIIALNAKHLPIHQQIELLLDFPFIQKYEKLVIDLPTLVKISKLTIPHMESADQDIVLMSLVDCFEIEMGDDPESAVDFLPSLTAFPCVFRKFFSDFPHVFDDYEISLTAIKFFSSYWKQKILITDIPLPNSCVSKEALFFILSHPYEEELEKCTLKGIKRYFEFITLESDPKYLVEYSTDWFALWYVRNVYNSAAYREMFIEFCIEDLVRNSQNVTHESSLKLEVGMAICCTYSHFEIEDLLDNPEREEFVENLQNAIGSTQGMLLDILHQCEVENVSLIRDFVLGEAFVQQRRRVITEMDITRHHSWDEFFDMHDIKR